MFFHLKIAVLMCVTFVLFSGGSVKERNTIVPWKKWYVSRHKLHAEQPIAAPPVTTLASLIPGRLCPSFLNLSLLCVDKAARMEASTSSTKKGSKAVKVSRGRTPKIGNWLSVTLSNF